MTDVDIHTAKEQYKDKLLEIDGVIGIGVETNAIVVNILSDEAAENVPDQLGNYTVKTRRVGDVQPEPAAIGGLEDPNAGIGERAGKFRPIPAGVSIGHKDSTAGTSSYTLTDGERYYLSGNNHVLADTNAGDHGDSVLQPGPVHEGDRVGTLDGYTPMHDGVTVDLAWANIYDQVGTTTDVLGVAGPHGEIYDPQPGDTVVKSGINTGVQHGEVLQIDTTIRVNYGDEVITLENQIITENISAPGDSGSPLLYQGRPAGMCFAGSDEITVAMTAREIERQSGMTIVTTDRPETGVHNAVWTFRARPNQRSRYSMGVLDGDTFDVIIDQGFGGLQHERLRLKYVDTAEIFGSVKGSDEYERAVDQRDFVRQWMLEAQDYAIDTEAVPTNWPLIVRTERETGKYGRYVAEVFNHREESLGAALVEEFGERVDYDDQWAGEMGLK